MPNDSRAGTEAHINTVNEIGKHFIERLEERLRSHDASKLEHPEISLLDRLPKHPKSYGNKWKHTKDKKQYLARVKMKFLDHHYKMNRHHPEHFYNGIDGMTLLDILEMYFDWCAAVIRVEDGNIYQSIQYNENRFNMSPQLTRIFMNTSIELDEKLRNMVEKKVGQ